MPSRSSALRAIIAKDARELIVSRPMLLVAAATGPLVAHAFSTAMDSYAEASGVGGGAAALAQALSPLDGFVSPLLGAYAVVAMLLFPFVAIRAVAGEKSSGAHGLMLQGPHSIGALVASKFTVLVAGWLALWIPAVIALLFWSASGGHLNATETIGVFAGHFLRGAFIAALGIACAAVADSAASAAVIALAVTLGGWALDFTAAVRGGIAETLAKFTPDSALRTFEHGDVQLGVILGSVAAVLALVVVGAIMLEPARRVWRSRAIALGVLAVLIVVAVPVASLRNSWDLSEDARNSFHPADAAALAAITEPVRVSVHLGPQDPRRTDLERSVLRKLRRAAPDVRIEYVSRTSSGLFEGPNSGYGEVWYEIAGKKAMNRSSSPTTALATVYELAGRAEPARAPLDYPGYPLRAAAATWQIVLLALGWPLLVTAAWWRARRVNPSATEIS